MASYGTFRVPAFWIENTLVLMTARILATTLIVRGASVQMIAVIAMFAVLAIGVLARARRATSIRATGARSRTRGVAHENFLRNQAQFST